MTILDAISEAVLVGDVALRPSPGIAAFVTDIDPPVYPRAAIPAGGGATFEFLVTFTGQPCDPENAPFSGELELTVDGVAQVSADVTIAQPLAAAVAYGSGWPGTLLEPTLGASAPPVLGTAITIDVSNSLGVGTPGCMLVGVEPASTLSEFGGTLLVTPTVEIAFDVASPSVSLPYGIRNDPTLCGRTLYLQAVQVDPGASHGLSFTNGLRITIGT